MTDLRACLPGLLLAATLPAAVAAQSARGTGYTTEMTTDSGGRKITTSIQMAELGAKFLTRIKSDGAGQPVEMFTVIDSVAGTVTQVMPAASIAMIVPASLMKQGAQPNLTMEMQGSPKVDVVDLGAAEPILGHATRRSSQTLAYTIKVTVGGESCAKPIREVADVWTTGEVQLPDLTSAVQRFTGTDASSPFARFLDSLQSKTVKGTVLRRAGTSTTVSGQGDTLRVISTMQVTALNLDGVDPREFEVPDGYRVMDMRDQMAAMGPGAMQEAIFAAQLKAADKIKAILCPSGGAQKP